MRHHIQYAAHIGLVWFSGYFLIVMSAVAVRAVNRESIQLIHELKIMAICAIAVFSLGFVHGLWKKYQYDEKYRIPKKVG